MPARPPLARNVMLARRHLPPRFRVGVNIGRGREHRARSGRLDDYLAAYRVVAPVADYVAVNVSSPNTPGLRDLQEPDLLVELLRALAARRRAIAHGSATGRQAGTRAGACSASRRWSSAWASRRRPG